MKPTGRKHTAHFMVAAVWIGLAGCAAMAEPISPFLIGQNLWNSSYHGGHADKLWPALQEGGFALIRVGGIALEEEPPSVEQYAQWVDSIRAIGAQPLLQVSSIAPASQAAQIVRHINVTLGRDVRFWTIGNEPTCGKPLDNTRLAQIRTAIVERSLAMKDVDPSIRILVGEECYWRGELYEPLIGGDFDVTGRDAKNRWIVDGVAFHSYPLPWAKTTPFSRNEVLVAGDGLRSMMNSCVATVNAANTRHGRSGSEALVWALTEFNVSWWSLADNSPAGWGNPSFLGGQFIAEIVGEGMLRGAFTMAPWSIHESGGARIESDLGMFDGAGPFVPRPNYYHLQMLSRNMARGNSLPASTNIGLVRAYAAQRDDTVAVLVLNRLQTDSIDCTLRLNAAPAQVTSELMVVVDAGWDAEYVDRIPAQSSLLVLVGRDGRMLRRTLYTLAMAEAFQPPVCTVADSVTVRVPGRAPLEPAGGYRRDPAQVYAVHDIRGRIRVGRTTDPAGAIRSLPAGIYTVRMVPAAPAGRTDATRRLVQAAGRRQGTNDFYSGN